MPVILTYFFFNRTHIARIIEITLFIQTGKLLEIACIERDKRLILRARITKEETFVQLIFRRSCRREHRTVNPYQIGSQESKTLIRVHVELHRTRAGALCEQSIISSIKSRDIDRSITLLAFIIHVTELWSYNFSFIANNACGQKKNNGRSARGSLYISLICSERHRWLGLSSLYWSNKT